MALVWPWSVIDPLNPFRAVDTSRALLRGALARIVRRRADLGPRHAAQLCADAVRAEAAGDFLAARHRRHAPARWSRAARASSRPTAARSICSSRSPPRCRSRSRSRCGRRCTTASAISCSCCRRSRCWAASPARGCSRRCAARHRRLALAAAICLVGIALPVVEMARLHPFEYTYFNRLAGGVAARAATATCSTIGGCRSNRRRRACWPSSPAHETKPAGPPLEGRGLRPAPFAAGRARAGFRNHLDPKGADFAMMLGEFYCARLDAPVMAEVVRDGVRMRASTISAAARSIRC